MVSFSKLLAAFHVLAMAHTNEKNTIVFSCYTGIATSKALDVNRDYCSISKLPTTTPIMKPQMEQLMTRTSDS